MISFHRPAAASRARRRAGFSLIELVVAMVMFSILGGVMTVVLLRQHRFYTGVNDIIEMRTQLRQATSIAVSDLRAIGPTGGDVVSMSDSALEVRAQIGTSAVCRIISPTALVIPPLVLARKSVITAWLYKPAAGDSVLIYDDGRWSAGNLDDVWTGTQLQTAPLDSAGICTNNTGMTTVADNSSFSYHLNLVTGVSTTVRPGAPVRFFRHVRYNLFQPSGGKWYLGYADCVATRSPVCSTPTPIAGPFLPYGATGASGVRFAFRDSTGTVTTIGTRVARIDVELRAPTTRPINIPGRTVGTVVDSAFVSAGIRNRR